MKKTRRDLLLILAVFIVFLTGRWISFTKTTKYEKITQQLLSTPIHEIIALRIYLEDERFIEFKPPDQIIDDFFHAISDIDSYTQTHGTVASQEHSWFMEIITPKNPGIQIVCYIPAERGAIVVGTLGEFTPKKTSRYGNFKSQQLFNWYYKYSYRWVNAHEIPEN